MCVMCTVQCDRELQGLLLSNTKGTPQVGCIRGGCSPATEAIAEISYFYNITQVSLKNSCDILYVIE